MYSPRPFQISPLRMDHQPSGNLDTANKKELHELFFELRAKFNQTFVIVTHNQELANMADRKLEMRDGMIINNKNS